MYMKMMLNILTMPILQTDYYNNHHKKHHKFRCIRGKLNDVESYRSLMVVNNLDGLLITEVFPQTICHEYDKTVTRLKITRVRNQVYRYLV
jgi:hypothetical protein